ncbi:MAG TPA: hypothetical protein VHQ89_08095 [Gaiellaceae bacterium]|jgi:hypothetical protein|nr:hypothetical protein [Gaiellaceae bacterium]
MSLRPHIDVQSPLAEALQPSVRVCESTLETYGDQAESQTGASFFAAVVLALAGMERAVESSYGDPTHDASLLIAASLCREAASSVRKHGLDEGLLRCADACERAAHICRAAVGHARA